MSSALAARSAFNRNFAAAIARRSLRPLAVQGTFPLPPLVVTMALRPHSFMCGETLAPGTKEFLLTHYCSERCGGCCICSRWSCVYSPSSSLCACAHRPTAAIYRGTVNDPTPFPAPSKTHGSYHWAFERILSAGLVPLTVASFVTSGTNYPIIDGLLGVSLVMHSHIGVRVFVYFSLTPTLLLPPCSAQPRPCRSGCRIRPSDPM